MKYPTALGLALLAPWSATAQTVSEPPRLPTITVPASPTILSTPAAGDVWTGEEMRQRSVERIEDLQSQSPNLVARSGGTRSINMVLGYRGLVNNAFYGEPAVALYVDDVPYWSPLSYDLTFLDVARVELLRGPQFTRWGRQGPGGLLAVYSEPPGDRLRSRAEVGFASHDEQSYKLRIDGPLSPTLGFSLSGAYARRDGYLYNELTKERPDYEEGFSGRFSLHWQASPDLEVKFIVSGQTFDDGVQRLTNLDSTPYTIAHDFSGVTRTNSDLQSLQLRYSGRDLLFTSITSRRSFRLDPGSFDLDFSPQPILLVNVNSEQAYYSQEFRLQPARPEKTDWFLGAYAAYGESDVAVTDNVFVSDSTLTDKTLSLYGEVTQKFNNRVSVTLGARGEVVEKTAERSLLYPTGFTTHETLGRTISNFSPKLGVTWQANDQVMLYGSTSLSYRSGAYSLFNFQPEILNAATERTWANEIGAKGRFFDDRLEVSLAGFWYEIRDYQIERYLLAGSASSPPMKSFRAASNWRCGGARWKGSSFPPGSATWTRSLPITAAPRAGTSPAAARRTFQV